MTSNAHARLKRVGIFCLLFLFFICMTAEAKGQTIYEYKDESGAVVITDKPPDKKIKSIKKYEYKPEESPSAAPRSAGPEAKGLKFQQRGPEARPPAAPEGLEKQRKEEYQKYQAEENSRREEAARQIEQEAMKPIPYSRENVKRQNELLDRAQKIRTGQEPLPDTKE
jgi:hypothetical protein